MKPYSPGILLATIGVLSLAALLAALLPARRAAMLPAIRALRTD
jgi:ABC-type lipoprotein release transport system permease subunit